MEAKIVLTLNEYDSEFFNVKMGNLKYLGDVISGEKSDSFLQEALQEADTDGYKYVVFKVMGEDNPLRKTTIAQEFELCMVNVEQRLDVRNGFNRKGKPQDVYVVREALVGDIGAVESITADAFRRSRLYKTGFLTQKAVDDYHKKWSCNLIMDKESVVSVVEYEGKVWGYMSIGVTEDNREGRLILGAVHSQMRRKGLVTLLVDDVIEKVAEGVDFIYAKTQEDNIPSINCWKSFGFNFVDKEYVYHKVLGTESKQGV